MMTPDAKSGVRSAARLGRSRMAGISLIEMLIALLVLSFGLLGMAGLQTYSLRNNTSAYQRSQATMLAYDIVDRMRANRLLAVGTAPVTPNSIAASAYNITLNDAIPAAGGAIPQQDLREWLIALGGDGGAVQGRLPNGDGAVQCNVSTAVCTVSVQWNDGRVAGTRPVCDDTTASGAWSCFRYTTEL